MITHVGLHSGKPANDVNEIEDFLDAASDLERELETEPGILVRQLTRMLRRQAEFKRLHDRFGMGAHTQ